jgi:hypothetical protein
VRVRVRNRERGKVSETGREERKESRKMGYYIKYILSITMRTSVIPNSEPGHLASYSNQRK